MAVVEVDRSRDEIAIITLNRPESLNAMSLELIGDLHDVLDDLDNDGSLRVAILTGAGKGFCSGLDLSVFGGTLDGDEGLGGVQSGMRFQQAIATLVTKIRSLRHPVIAAINGAATGGGLALALACDTRVCSESARFSAAFVRLGVSGCDIGVSYLLPKIVGPTLAFEMMLSGRLVSSDEARQSGMVLNVVPDGKVIDAALEVASNIQRNSPFGVWMTKEVMWANLDAPSLQSAIDLENRTQILSLRTSDSKEAAAAFIEKRKPQFKNR